jgi:metallo-beta-lactamase family protein
MIQLGFYGAAGEVTGSCYLLTTDRARVMIDCGMHQGEPEAGEHNHRMPPIDLAGINAVVLTHAHLDHCGRLPMLMPRGFRGRVYCTTATKDVTEIVLRDSAGIQMEDCDRFNRNLRRGAEPCLAPLYDDRDVEHLLKQLSPIAYDQPQTVADGVTIRFINSGHILGAASVLMTVNDGQRTVTIAFSGDIGVAGSPILHDPVTPAPADVVLLESTYGDRDHRPLPETRDELLSILQRAQAAGAKVIIPSFAVGRTQELIFHIGEFLRAGKLSPLQAYVDSPMASSLSRLYATHQDGYNARAAEMLANQQSPLDFPGLTFIRSVEESKRLNQATGFLIIISASGMCTGGRILHHLRHNLGNPKTQVVIVGYQGAQTLGRQLVEGAKSVMIFREPVAVRASIHTLGGFSAHAGQSGLLAWATPFQNGKPRIFLTHGENGPRAALRDQLKLRLGLESSLPRYGEIATL